ncbi:MAG: hypothetical protein ACLQVW_02735 [Limisphaerales bacterium]
MRHWLQTLPVVRQAHSGDGDKNNPIAVIGRTSLHTGCEAGLESTLYV